jgi:mannose-6-phosphate isomerase-like protein (cupin superfamily)
MKRFIYLPVLVVLLFVFISANAWSADAPKDTAAQEGYAVFKANSERATQVMEKMYGGNGKVIAKFIFKKGEIKASARMIGEATLPPGASIGLHKHIKEDDVLIFTKGKGEILLNGKKYTVGPGDVTVAGDGGSHSIKNIGKGDLKFIAITLPYCDPAPK